MPKPSTPRPTLPTTPAAVPDKATRGAEPPTVLTPLPEKIGEGPGNLKAREEAFKRRTGMR